MRRAGRHLAAAFAVLAAMLALAACGSDESATGPQRLDLKIGDLVPLTGFLEQFGQPGQQAADLAVDEIRKAAAKAGAQHKVTITHADYKSQPGEAQKAALKFVKGGSSCILGPWGTNQVDRVAKQLAVPRKVVLISPSASGDALTKAEDRGYVFRVVPPDRMQADALAELLDDKLRGARGKELNVAALESTYGADLTKDFEDAWTGKGGRIAQQVTYPGDQSTFEGRENFKKQVEAVSKGKPDAWVFFDFQDTYTQAATQMMTDKSVGFSPKKAFGTESLATARLATNPTVSEGLRGVAIGAPRQGQVADEFDRRYKARGLGKRQTYDAQQFDAVVLCYLSAVAAGSTKGDRMADKVREVSAAPGRKFTWLQLDQAIKALEAGQDIDYQGASGPIDMNDDGDPTAGVYDVYEFKRGKQLLREQIAVPDRPGGI